MMKVEFFEKNGIDMVAISTSENNTIIRMATYEHAKKHIDEFAIHRGYANAPYEIKKELAEALNPNQKVQSVLSDEDAKPKRKKRGKRK